MAESESGGNGVQRWPGILCALLLTGTSWGGALSLTVPFIYIYTYILFLFLLLLIDQNEREFTSRSKSFPVPGLCV